MYERLKHDFVLEERGDVDVKGKGVMHTWYLVGRRNGENPQRDGREVLEPSSSKSAAVTSSGRSSMM